LDHFNIPNLHPLSFDFSILANRISLGPVIHTANHSLCFDWADNYAFSQAKPASMPLKKGGVNTYSGFFFVRAWFFAQFSGLTGLLKGDNGTSLNRHFIFPC
jgi:hypothetical protein